MIRRAAASVLAGLLASGALLAGGQARTWAVAVLPSGASFSLEIAADDAARERGYMFRERVGPREGMLFVFDGPGRYPFWMKNCKIPLDIVWLDEAFGVVDVAANLPPCREGADCPETTPIAASRYVLEFAGGTAAREHLKRGDRVVVLSEPPL